MGDPDRLVVWIGSSQRDLREMPPQVRRDVGFAIYAAQHGMTDPAAKPLKSFGGTRVMEIAALFRTGAYRAVYTAQFEDAVYVLHVFQKKSKSGIATPKHEIALDRVDPQPPCRGGASPQGEAELTCTKPRRRRNRAAATFSRILRCQTPSRSCSRQA